MSRVPITLRPTAARAALALLASLTVAMGTAPVSAAPGCTYKMSGQVDYDASGATVNHYAATSVLAGEVVCGGPGHDTVFGVDAGGIFLGRGGDDVVQFNSGAFFGGPGHDRVDYQLSSGARFRGGAGRDHIDQMNAGTFSGQRGNDSVTTSFGTVRGGRGADTVNSLQDGRFIGGAWTDRVRYLIGGTFRAGNGRDTVENQFGGRYFGGSRWDKVEVACGGERYSVEKLPAAAC